MIDYENPLMPDDTNTQAEWPLITGAYAAVRAADCSGNVSITYHGTGYLANVSAPAAGSYVQAVFDKRDAYVASANAGATGIIDARFIDNANDMYGVSPMPCGYAASSWTSAMDALLGALPGPLWLNTLAVGPIANQAAGLNAPSVAGGEYEGCYVNGAANWASTENAEIAVHREAKGFWCYANGSWSSSAADAVLSQRLFVYASFLLTADPWRDVFQEWLATPSQFKVMPETGIVPTAPAYGISTIEGAHYNGTCASTAPCGAYARSYGACYFRGAAIGPCEVVVNPSTSAVAVPNASVYAWAAALHGSDIMDGGAVTFDAPVPLTLAPQTAAILVK